MIRELNELIRQILNRVGEFNLIDVVFETPNREWTAARSTPTLNCFLFDIREHQSPNKNIQQQNTREERPSLTSHYFDLIYLISAWSYNVIDEHEILWRALEKLMRFPVINDNSVLSDEIYLPEALSLTTYGLLIPAKVSQLEGGHIFPIEFWTALGIPPKPLLRYEVTLAINHEAIVAQKRDESALSLELYPSRTPVDLRLFENYIKYQRRLYNTILVATGELGSVNREDLPGIIEYDTLIPEELRLKLAWIESGSIKITLKSKSYDALRFLADFFETKTDDGSLKEQGYEVWAEEIRRKSKFFDEIIAQVDDQEIARTLKRYKNETILALVEQQILPIVRNVPQQNGPSRSGTDSSSSGKIQSKSVAPVSMSKKHKRRQV